MKKFPSSNVEAVSSESCRCGASRSRRTLTTCSVWMSQRAPTNRLRCLVWLSDRCMSAEREWTRRAHTLASTIAETHLWHPSYPCSLQDEVDSSEEVLAASEKLGRGHESSRTRTDGPTALSPTADGVNLRQPFGEHHRSAWAEHASLQSFCSVCSV